MSEAQMDRTNKLFAAGRNLWLAGLGAVAEVEEGTLSLFDRLIEKGRPVEARQKKAAEAVAEKAKGTAVGLTQLVQDTVEYESREMLKRLNVMTREDVKILSARLETLSKKIDEYAARREAAASVTAELIPNSKTVTGTPKAAARPRQRKTTRER